MLVFLKTIRVICGLIAIWQILGLLPVLGWLSNLGAVTANMWALLVLKGTVLTVFGSIFYALRKPIAKRQRISAPADPNS